MKNLHQTFNPKNFSFKEAPNTKEFWAISSTEKDGNTSYKVEFSNLAFINFLAENDIFRFALNNHFIFAKTEKHIIRPMTGQEIRDFALEYLHQQKAPDMVKEKILKGAGQYFSESNLANLFYKNIPEIQAQAAYMDFYFQNAIVRVSADHIKILDSQEQEGFVWEENVIEHPISLLPKTIEPSFENEKYDFEQVQKDSELSAFYWFLEKASAFHHDKKTPSPQEIAEQKLGLLNKLSALGYLLHNYKAPEINKAVIAMDYKIADVYESNGGTGKSLFANALQKVLSTKYINARNAKVFENPHWNEGITHRTRLLFIDDTGIKFDFGTCYNLLTGIWTINPKNRQQYDILPKQSPKIYIATNYAIEGNGESDLRRQFLVAFSDFFNKERTPAKYFYHRFFEDWDVSEWNRFYNLLFEATQIYLKYGLIEGNSQNLEIRKLRQNMGEDFLDWAEVYFSDNQNLQKEIPKKEAYETFQEQSNNRFMKIGKFKKNLQLFAKMKGWAFVEKKTSGVEYFEMQKNISI